MHTIRISKIFNFEMAHALDGHSGLCKHIHGHSYKLTVCVKGNIHPNKSELRNSMVMDYTKLKKIVHQHIIDKFDHSLVLDKNSPYKELANFHSKEKLIFITVAPTCENLLVHFVELIQQYLPETVQLHHLILKETETSFAGWHAEDNV